MASPNNGEQYSKEYLPDQLHDVMYLCRLLNANEQKHGGSMRYITVCNIHEGIDVTREILVLDAVEDVYRNVASLLLDLSPGYREYAVSEVFRFEQHALEARDYDVLPDVAEPVV